MQVEQSILDIIHRRQLKSYGHLLRMDLPEDSVRQEEKGKSNVTQWG